MVTPSLNYWTQAITISSYQLPFEHDNYQGRKSLSVDSGTHKKGRDSKESTDSSGPRILFHTFQITPQVRITPQEFPESYCYVFELRKETKIKHPNFP